MKVIIVLATALAVSASPAAAQPLSEKKWDAAVLTGLFLGNPPPTPGSHSYDQWLNTGELGFSAARYLTRHLKVEVEGAFTGEGRIYADRLQQLPGFPHPVPVALEHHISTRAISASVGWQFLENQWVHPYLLAGLAYDVERNRLDEFQSFVRRGDPYTVDHVRGIVGVGAKVYFNARGFFRLESRVAAGDGSHVAFRLGLGADF